MVSRHMLSKEQYQCITSQEVLVSNKSEQLKRISEKVDQAFKTFDIILISNGATQEYKDKLFDHEKIRYFLDGLIRYDSKNPLGYEINKQKIAKDVIKLGVDYFLDRYKQTHHLKKQIDEFQSLLQDIDFLAELQQEDTEGMKLYRLRSKHTKPPVIFAEKDFWIAACIHCYSRSLHHSQSERDAIKNIKHEKGCSYLQDVKKHGGKYKKDTTYQYIRIYPPKDLKKKK